MDNDSVVLEAISKRLIAIQTTCDKARTDINKILKDTTNLASIVQEAIALLPSDNEFVKDTDIITLAQPRVLLIDTKSIIDVIRGVSNRATGSGP